MKERLESKVWLKSTITWKLRGVEESRAVANLANVVENWRLLTVWHRLMTAGLVNRGLTARREAEMEAKRENEARRVIDEDDMICSLLSSLLLLYKNTVLTLCFKSEEKKRLKQLLMRIIFFFKRVNFYYFCERSLSRRSQPGKHLNYALKQISLLA